MKSLKELINTPNLCIQRTGQDGGSGYVQFGNMKASVIWSNGGGWEHVSMAPYKHSYVPSWDDMCRLKNMFFGPDEWVVQFHPPESEYVNNMVNCLHLWRPLEEKLPTPPSWMVGLKKGEKVDDFTRPYHPLSGGPVRRTL